jgi:SnoaL-like polyketide cyclase
LKAKFQIRDVRGGNLLTSDANKALIRLWGEEGFNKNNMAVADKVYAADVFYHEPTAGEVIGLEPLKQFVVKWRTAFPDALCRIDEWVAEG